MHSGTESIFLDFAPLRRAVSCTCLVTALLAMLLVSGSGTPAALATTSGDTCTEIPGYVSFGELQVLPEAPEVGDSVELRFETSIAVYSLLALNLVGAELLSGDTTLLGTRTAIFQLTAIKAGRMNVHLEVTYATELQCIGSNRVPYISSYGPDRSVASPSYVVDIAEATCVGDCNRDGQVTVDELLTLVNIALGDALTVFSCPASDQDGDRVVQVTEILRAVNRALGGCAAPQAGYCYESSFCSASKVYPFAPFSTNRGRCCDLQRTLSGPFSWCPEADFDPDSAACTQCEYPC